MNNMELKNKLMNDTIGVLKVHDKQYEENTINDIISYNLNKKQAIEKMLSNTKNWDETDRSTFVEFEHEYKIDVYSVNKNCIDLFSAINDYMWNYYDNDKYAENIKNNYEWSKRVYNLIYWLVGSCVNKEAIIDDDFIFRAEKITGIKFGQGMKITRAIRKILDWFINTLNWMEFSDTQKTVIERYYALFSESCAIKTIKKKIYFSLNIADFLTMSSGNSWRSCHNIDSGEYQSGCLSYGLDNVTLIAFEKNDNDRFIDSKITRRVIFLNDNKVYFSRLYGGIDQNTNDIYLKAFKECFNTELELLSQSYRFDDAFSDSVYYTHYPDYHFSYSDSALYTMDNIKIDTLNNKIGHEPICVECGETHRRHDELSCNNCNDNTITCSDCGSIIESDSNDYIIIDNRYYCMDCVSWCEGCNEYFPSDEMQETDDGLRCEACIENNYIECVECGSLIHYKNAIETHDGDYVCENCYEWYYFICYECDEIFHINDSKIMNGERVCTDCFIPDADDDNYFE